MSESYSQDGEKVAVMVMRCESDSHPFHERHIILDEVVKVGRSVARIRPSPENAIFDCKVLSRNHALIWYRDGQFWLRDTNSSNGTFVNNTRVTKRVEDDNADRELFSGDIIRFGVDVVENDTTHGSIITQISLYLPNGKEARSKELYDNSAHDMVNSEPYHAEQLFLLTNSINKALFREQILEAKLNQMKSLLEETQKMSEEGWQAMLNEEYLLERLNLYEDQLSLIKRNLPEHSLQYCVTELQQEKFDLEKASKVMLERVISEKTEALTKAAKLESCLTDSERDCAHLRKECESTQEAYQSIITNFESKIAELGRVEKQLREVVDEKQRLENELMERSKDYQLLKEKLSGALYYNASPKAPVTNHSTIDQPGENVKESFVAVNGLDNGERSERAEQLGDVVERTGQLQNSLSQRADEVRDEVAIAELMELDRFCDIQERLANSESNLEHMLDTTSHDICNHLSSNIHLLSHQHQSVQLIKALQAELDVLTSLRASIPNGGLSLTTPSPDADSVVVVGTSAVSTANPSDGPADTTANAADKFSAALDRAKKLALLVGTCQACDSSSCVEAASSAHPQTSGDAVVVSFPKQSVQSGADSEQHNDLFKTDLDQQQRRLLEDAITSDENLPSPPNTPQFAVTAVTSSSSTVSLDDELARLQDELRVSAKETEMYKQLAEKLKCQDDSKAELLLSVRNECDALRGRISQIESEVANNRIDHQRLALEAKRARVEAEELRQARDQLTSELSASEAKIEKLLQTQNAFHTKGNATENSLDFPAIVSSTQETAIPNSPDQVTESLDDGEVHRTAAGLLSVNGVSTTTTPSLIRPTEHANQRSPVVTMLSLAAVIPVMVLLCALMAFILSKFKP